MSLILDALRRAEQERQQGRAPGLSELPASTASRRPPLPWKGIAAAGLGLAGALALILALRQPAAEPAYNAERPAPSTAISQPVVADPPPPPVATTSPPAATSTRAPALKGVASLDTMDDLLEPLAPVRTAPKPARPAPTIAPVDLSQRASVSPPQPTAATSDSERSAEPSAAAPSPLLGADNVLLSGPPVTPLRDMPPGYRADFPSLNVDVHVYNDEPQRRFVLLNLRRYREGQTLSEGPKIIEIQADGIVFDFRGERVLMALPR